MIIKEIRDKVEYLTVRSADYGGLKVRTVADAAGKETGKVLEGTAVVFNSMSESFGETLEGNDIREMIDPHALDECMKGSPDIRALKSHDWNLVLGRTAAGTLSLSLDDKGLHCSIAMPNTTYANDLIESVNRGDINGMSFGFVCDYDSIEYVDDEENNRVIRTIKRIISLHEVSAVAFPAYPDTEVHKRNCVAGIQDFEKIAKRSASKAASEIEVAQETLSLYKRRLDTQK